jgi:hypothetical protein
MHFSKTTEPKKKDPILKPTFRNEYDISNESNGGNRLVLFVFVVLVPLLICLWIALDPSFGDVTLTKKAPEKVQERAGIKSEKNIQHTKETNKSDSSNAGK